MSTLCSDLPFLLRSLRRSTGYAAAVFVTLALGLGVVTAIFSAMDQTVFRKPHPHYDRLVEFGYKPVGFDWISNSYLSQVEPCVARGRAFEALAIEAWGRAQLVTQQETLGVDYGCVNEAFFEVLGARAGLGRLFLPADFQEDAKDVLVLTYPTWKGTFGGDASILGRSAVLEGRTCRIVGVLAQDSSLPPGVFAGVFRPGLPPPDPSTPFRPRLTTLGRLRPGVTLAQANAEVAVLGAAMNDIGRLKGTHPELKRLASLDPRTSFTGIHGAFLGAVGFLYAIACLNTVCLMVVRLSGRRRELGVRVALGAGRWTLVRLVAAESLGLCLLAGLAGLAVAWALLPAVLDLLLPGNSAFGPAAKLDGRAALFCLGASLFTAFLVAVMPAWRMAGADPQRALKEGDVMGGESPRMGRLREGLAVLGAALALVLLAGTGLMTRSVQNLLKADRGFDPAGKVAVWLDLPKALQETSLRHDLAVRLEERIGALPGVRGASTAHVMPLEGRVTTHVQRPDGTDIYVGSNAVSAGYVQGLKLKLLKGQWLPRDGADPVLVLNATMAQQWFGAADPIGRSVTFKDKPWRVIGMVADVKDRIRDPAYPQFYFPDWMDEGPSDVLSILVDCARKPDAGLLKTLRQAIHEEEPRVGVRLPMLLEELAAQELARERFTLRILQMISALALTLAVLGLFSVMAYSVGQRSREFGVRLALGAKPSQVFGSVLKRGLVLGGFGVALGLCGAWGLTRFLQSLLYETNPLDARVYFGVSTVVLAATALASFLPALRAARTDPATLLKTE